MKRHVATPDIIRLWVIGGTNNVVRWLEILAAALFTLEVTDSGFAVAVVSAARSLPLLLCGALAGVVSESVDRKRILLIGMTVVAGCSATIATLAYFGAARPWHIAVAALVAGVVWSTDMSTRRRMVGDLAPDGMVSRAVAVDSLAGAMTRMTGPIMGAAAYGLIGLSGAFACTTVITLLSIAQAWPIHHVQETQRLKLSRVPRDLADAVVIARREPVVRAVLGVTIAMNLFAFSYTAVVAPLGRLVFAMPTALVGLLAAAEPLGSLIGGFLVASVPPGTSPRLLMLGGSGIFVLGLILLPAAPGYPVACLLLLLGGIGLAGFSNMQTTLILTGTPAPVRSRLLGLITVCMGTGPIGLLMIGALADRIGPLVAVQFMALIGMAALVVVGTAWVRAK